MATNATDQSIIRVMAIQEIEISRFGQRLGPLNPPAPGYYSVLFKGTLQFWEGGEDWPYNDEYEVQMHGKMLVGGPPNEGFWPIKMGVVLISNNNDLAGERFAIYEGTLWLDHYLDREYWPQTNIWIDGRMRFDDKYAKSAFFKGLINESKIYKKM